MRDEHFAALRMPVDEGVAAKVGVPGDLLHEALRDRRDALHDEVGVRCEQRRGRGPGGALRVGGRRGAGRQREGGRDGERVAGLHPRGGSGFEESDLRLIWRVVVAEWIAPSEDVGEVGLLLLIVILGPPVGRGEGPGANGGSAVHGELRGVVGVESHGRGGGGKEISATHHGIAPW